MKSFFGWLKNSTKIKRWITLILIGMALACYGFAQILVLDRLELMDIIKIVITFVAGASMFIIGLVHIQKRTFELAVLQDAKTVSELGDTKDRGPKIVVIGGGNGLNRVYSGEDSCRGALSLDHTASDDCDERESVVNGNAVGLEGAVKRCDKLFAERINVRSCNDNAHRVDTGGHMLESNAVFLKDFKHTASVADLRVHKIVLNGEYREAASARNTCDDMLAVVIRSRCDDHGSVVAGTHSVSDIDRDARDPYGEDGVLVKNGRTHIRELAKLTVCNRLNGAGILDYSRVSHHKARDVCPVFVKVCARRTCYDRACNIGTAAGECLDRTVGHKSVETGDDSTLVACKFCRENLVGLICVKGSVVLEEDNVFGVDEIKADELCENKSGEIFSSARCEIASGTAEYGVLDIVQLAADIKVETEVRDDTQKAGTDIAVAGFKFFLGGSVSCKIIALIKHIGDLDIV